MSEMRSGSILLIALFITSLLLLTSLLSWQKCSYLTELATERERFYQRFYQAEMVLNAGVSLIKKTINQVLQKASPSLKDPLIIDFITDPTGSFPPIKARLLINRVHSAGQTNALFLRVLFMENDRVVSTLGCILTREIAPATSTPDPLRTKGTYFVVNHFTIGNFV